jgi:lactoylglutathione lyase
MTSETDRITERAEPETFRGRSLSVSLTVKDLGVSLTWYRDVVGFVVEREYERDGKRMAVALKTGDLRILLNQDDGAKGWDREKGAGISLHFTTAQDVDAVAQRIKDRGGRLASEPADTPWGVRAFRVVDPDGFKLSIASERLPTV